MIGETFAFDFGDCLCQIHLPLLIMCRVMVLRDGQIVEFDVPNQLLAMKGVFYDIAKDAGLA